MKLTDAEIRGLEAVEAGRVTREYSANGNVFKTPRGVGPSTIWRLERMKMITDDRSPGHIVYGVLLTEKGKEALRKNRGEQ